MDGLLLLLQQDHVVECREKMSKGQSPTHPGQSIPPITWRLFTRPHFLKFPVPPKTIKMGTKLLTLVFVEKIPFQTIANLKVSL